MEFIVTSMIITTQEALLHLIIPISIRIEILPCRALPMIIRSPTISRQFRIMNSTDSQRVMVSSKTCSRSKIKQSLLRLCKIIQPDTGRIIRSAYHWFVCPLLRIILIVNIRSESSIDRSRAGTKEAIKSCSSSTPTNYPAGMESTIISYA